jgi:hypothetical protein
MLVHFEDQLAIAKIGRKFTIIISFAFTFSLFIKVLLSFRKVFLLLIFFSFSLFLVLGFFVVTVFLGLL